MELMVLVIVVSINRLTQSRVVVLILVIVVDPELGLLALGFSAVILQLAILVVAFLLLSFHYHDVVVVAFTDEVMTSVGCVSHVLVLNAKDILILMRCLIMRNLLDGMQLRLRVILRLLIFNLYDRGRIRLISVTLILIIFEYVLDNIAEELFDFVATFLDLAELVFLFVLLSVFITIINQLGALVLAICLVFCCGEVLVRRHYNFFSLVTRFVLKVALLEATLQYFFLFLYRGGLTRWLAVWLLALVGLLFDLR